MGKKKIATMIVAVVAVAASSNIYPSKTTNALSDLALANVEALAGGEWGGDNCFWIDSNYTWCLPWGSGPGCPCYL